MKTNIDLIGNTILAGNCGFIKFLEKKEKEFDDILLPSFAKSGFNKKQISTLVKYYLDEHPEVLHGEHLRDYPYELDPNYEDNKR